MTPEDLSRLTIADLESLVGRMESAAKTFREALAVLGSIGASQAGLAQAVPPVAQQPTLHTGASANGRPAGFEPARGGSSPSAPMSPILMTPEREEYLAEIRADPQRAALLAQFRKDGPAQEESVRTEMLEAFGGGT